MNPHQYLLKPWTIRNCLGHRRPHPARIVLSRWLLLLAIALFPMLSHAGVSAQVDRNTINEGDTFTLTLTVSGSNHAQPDLSALHQDFDVLSTGQKSMIQIINGSLTSNQSWTVTLSPKHTGKLTIPPITVGNDRSNAVTVTVLPATASSGGSTSQADVFLDVSVKPAHQSYVQAQLLYTVRLYYAEPLRQGTLSDPSLNNAVVQKLGKDQHFTTVRGGRQYQVIERRYAIFPQSSGKLAIPSVIFDGRIDDPSAQTGDPFFDSFNPATRHVHLRSRTFHVKVKSQPAAYTGNNWLPAQAIQLQEKWSPHHPQFRVGEPVTRDIVIHAKGLSSSQLPNLPLPQQAGLKLYPDQAKTSDKPVGNTLEATREQKIAMIPTHAGDLTLPAIHLTWWDTKTQHQRTTSLPAETVHVLPAATTNNTSAPPSPNTAATPAPTNNKSAAAPPATKTKTTATNHLISQGPLSQKVWMALSLFFAIAWLVTIFLWWRRRPSPPHVQTTQDKISPTSHQVSVKRVRTACQQNDPRAIKHALLAWAQIRWPDKPPLSLGALGKRLSDKALLDELNKLERILYTPAAGDWHAETLLTLFNAYLKQQTRSTASDNHSALEPLYPQQSRTAGA